MTDSTAGVQTAVTNVNPAGSVKPATGTRGRKAIILKGGKPLAEARSEAKAMITAAKAEFKNAKAELAAASKNANVGEKTQKKAADQLAKVEPKALAEPKNAEAKGALTNAKNALKAADVQLKTFSRAVEAANKQIAKVQLVVDRAIAASLKIEGARLTS